MERGQKSSEKGKGGGAGMSLSYGTSINYYLPVDLLWLPSGTVRPLPLYKVNENKLPFLDHYFSGNRKERISICRQATLRHICLAGI